MHKIVSHTIGKGPHKKETLLSGYVRE